MTQEINYLGENRRDFGVIFRLAPGRDSARLRPPPRPLAPSDLRLLARWCAARGMRWQPLLHDDAAAVLLEPRLGPAHMKVVLTRDAEGFRLVGEAGEILARATRLGMLLDTL